MDNFACPSCGRRLPSKGFLRSHITRVHKAHNSMHYQCYPNRHIHIMDQNNYQYNVVNDGFDVPPTGFTSDTVCYSIYSFYNEFQDKAKPIFNSQPKLQIFYSQLSDTYRDCVKYACSENMSSPQIVSYYNHIKTIHALNGFSDIGELTTTFSRCIFHSLLLQY